MRAYELASAVPGCADRRRFPRIVACDLQGTRAPLTQPPCFSHGRTVGLIVDLFPAATDSWTGVVVATPAWVSQGSSRNDSPAITLRSARNVQHDADLAKFYSFTYFPMGDT
jgi:hypothetical protein